MSPIPSELLDLIVCPETRQRLGLAPDDLVKQCNLLCADGKLMTRAGSVVTEPMQYLLIRQDGQFGYPIRNGIPFMISSEAIPMREVASEWKFVDSSINDSASDTPSIGAIDSSLPARITEEDVAWDDQVRRVGAMRTILDPTDTLGNKNMYIDILTRLALDRMLQIDGKLVIDLGCGSGRLFNYFSSKARMVIGLDRSYELLKVAKRTHERFNAVLFDGENLPVREDSFDAVISVWCLQYMMRDPHFEHVVAQISSCLTTGGKAYLIERAVHRKKAWAARREHEYVDAFVKYGCSCDQTYPIRNTRSVMLYLIRYGLVPRGLLPWLAERELRKVRSPPPPWVVHQDQAFVFKKQQ